MAYASYPQTQGHMSLSAYYGVKGSAAILDKRAEVGRCPPRSFLQLDCYIVPATQSPGTVSNSRANHGKCRSSAMIHMRVYSHLSKLERHPFLLLASLLVLLLLPHPLRAQGEESYDERRKHALDLYMQGRFVDALPVLEKLHAEKPSDVGVLESLSFATLAHAATIGDPAGRKQERAKARKLADDAKAAGDTSNMLKTLLEVPED